jgi:1,4-dihydroxy-2-naphthoyl-CoA hydrolase
MLNFTKKRMNDYKEKILKICNETSKNTLMETLDIEYIDVGEDFLLAKMPVTPKVHQPDGVLHGGATAALAESVGSAASYVFLDGNKFFVRGIEISANHVKSIKEGFVYAKATILHKGRTTQLWEIRVTNEDDQLISLCKLTTITLPKA